MRRVVNRYDQRVLLQEGQREIKPQVPLLVVDNVWPEPLYLPQELPGESELANGLPQSWLIKFAELHGRIQQVAVVSRLGARQHQQHFAFAREAIGLLNAVLGEAKR